MLDVYKRQAQSVTYNHDSSKQNQITVMETGGGSLTPEFYYWLLHNNYKKICLLYTSTHPTLARPTTSTRQTC